MNEAIDKTQTIEIQSSKDLWNQWEFLRGYIDESIRLLSAIIQNDQTIDRFQLETWKKEFWRTKNEIDKMLVNTGRETFDYILPPTQENKSNEDDANGLG